MKVTSTKSIHFPKLNWGINAGDVKELPEEKESQEIILAHPRISKVEQSKSEERRIAALKTNTNADDSAS